VLLALPVVRAGITQAGLFDDPFYLLTPRGHRLARRKSVDAEVLKNEKLLLLEEGHCLRDQAINLCAPSGPGNIEEFGAASLATIVQLTGNGYGVTILPEMAIAVEARNQDHVSVTPFVKPRPSRTIGLAWRERSRREQDFLELGNIIREAGKSMAKAAHARTG
jgi:LysR family hydrogen peroxide-inducible transcriptional activator